MNTIIWSRLKNYKCPACNKLLTDTKGKKIFCSKKHFSVRYARFESMVNYVYRFRKTPKDWDEIILNTT